ncbi:MAG: PTS system, glucitol/sorbitol-specific IIA component [Anaerolineae bacterium]|nr:MAG: PTS system, glucitol/sorbitol-specific IIA component [Anaerolineae bacterium]
MDKHIIKYAARISEIGPLVDEFISAGVLVFFGQNAPDELREFSILHDGGTLVEDITVGDQFCLEDECFTILAVGEVANQNLKALGHFIIKFNGEHKPEMPGDICAEVRPLPPIRVGDYFSFTNCS